MALLTIVELVSPTKLKINESVIVSYVFSAVVQSAESIAPLPSLPDANVPDTT